MYDYINIIHRYMALVIKNSIWKKLNSFFFMKVVIFRPHHLILREFNSYNNNYLFHTKINLGYYNANIFEYFYNGKHVLFSGFRKINFTGIGSKLYIKNLIS